MTKEEIIKELYRGNSRAIKEAIKVLEQQPSEDCVSRQAVLNKKELIELPDGQSFYSIDPEKIEKMPPVTPAHGTCKDCEHYRRIELNSCDEVVATCKKHTDRNYQYVSPNFYCADFEKRGNEE